jgi:phage shock protein PspC (stress-responsive transcriptional regulator)
MKKNISINISGIIFHIEEDGYDTLRKYLDSISKYFSSFEDSSEIMADIESRIAELFLSKLNEGKQIITADDVSSLMATMGSVNDFKAAEQEFSKDESSEQRNSSDTQKQYTPPKQLLRDQKRKTLGGVCAGLGSYLNVDPVWIRLLFAILAFAYGVTILIYIVMWIVVPGSYDLDEPEITKKMFREPDKKVLGGVAGGLAAYLGIDVVATRVLFIALTFAGGFGMLVYIVLWLVLPEAKTLTDKMQMQGEPVTLSNIESTLKKNQSLNGDDDETPITKILLFPFRLIAVVLTSIAKLIGPLVEVLRVAIGAILLITGISLVLGLLGTGAVLLGVLSGFSLPFGLDSEVVNGDFPVAIFKSTFPSLTLLAAFVALVIPGVFLILLGISTMAKRIVFGAAAGWTLFVLFFASFGVLAISIPRIIYSFKEDGEFRIEKTYQPTGKTVLLKLNERGLENYKVASLTLRGHDGKDFKLVQTFEAQGSTRAIAIENAHMIDYEVNFQDSVFTFDSNIQFKKDARFRGQHLSMTLYIPYDFPFIMTEEVSRFITQVVEHENLDGNTWKMTNEGLTCITCKNSASRNGGDGDSERRSDFSDFDAIHINGIANATIVQGDSYAVELIGPTNEKEYYEIYQRGETLIVDYDNDDTFFWKKKFNLSPVRIRITLPALKQLELKGAGNVTIGNFNIDEIDINIFGAVTVQGELHAKDISITMSGASSLELDGEAKNLEATIQGASTLKAFDLQVVDANIEVYGASHAKVNVSGTLEMEENIASDIDYHGNPHIIKHD